ncbi:MAG: hypothetical protein WAU88_07880 [Candidatus Zixiibacteriota bacterium]
MKRTLTRPSSIVVLLAVTVLALSLGLWGCSENNNGPISSDQSQAGVLSPDNPQVQAVMVVQNRHTGHLMQDPEVIGTATSLDANGHPAVLLLVTSQRALAAAPKTLDGVPVEVLLTDKVVAMAGVSHKSKQTPPIQMGTSGGWAKDLANGYCCGGTLGALINVGGTLRVLSNYHVLEADIVSGGNGTVATTGDNVIQPGLIDVNCSAASAQVVAKLVKTSSLPGSNVDCSSANIVSGMVNPNGSILEIGTLTSATIAASVGQAVKKSGRTTGLTRSKVSGLNATISVSYENECAGGTAFTKTFTGQILVTNTRSKFLGSGDSGSLLVQDVTTNPRAIGLLFAGSTSIAVANPINSVLSFLGATMVGN